MYKRQLPGRPGRDLPGSPEVELSDGAGGMRGPPAVELSDGGGGMGGTPALELPDGALELSDGAGSPPPERPPPPERLPPPR